MTFNELRTPCYVLEEEKLSKNYYSLIKAFKDKWDSEVIVGYSFKTNSLPWILTWMKAHNAYAEVVSSDEFELAKKLGFSADKIIINGPVKGFSSILEILNGGGIVNLDSFSEIELIENNKPLTGKWKVGLRFNFNLEKECPGETIMGEEPGRFGFNIENGSFTEAIRRLEVLDYVSITGLHAHHSTKTKSLKIFNALSNKLVELSRMINHDLEYVDIGGCLFGDKPGAPTFDDYAETVINVLAKGEFIRNAKIVIEPGASIIASPMSYICSVLDIKEVSGKRILTTNGSLIHIDPQMHGIKFLKDVVRTSNKDKQLIKEQILAGFTCIEKDRLGVFENEKELSVDDKVLFYNTGAYSMTLSPLFISYYPDVYIKNDDEYTNVRRKWTVENFLQNNEVFK